VRPQQANSGSDLAGKGHCSRRVLVVEERWSGHLLVFVRLIASYSLSMGDQVFLAVGRSVPETAEYRENLSDLNVPTAVFEGPLTGARLERLASNVGADLVVVPHGDELGTRLGASLYRVRCPLVLLIMRDPRWERPTPPARRARNLLKLLFLRRADLRQNVNLVWLRHFGYSGPDRYVVDPYVGDGSVEEIRVAGLALRARLSLTDSTFWFLITGAITDRKNVRLIALALSRLQRARPERTFGLALIGPHRTTYPIDAQSLRALTGGSFPIVNDDRLLSNFEMNAVISGADAVVMAYDTHSPNSTMLKARVLGTRLVVAGPPSLRAFARDMGFSSVVHVELKALAEAMQRESCTPPPPPCPSVPDGDAFALGLLSYAETRTK
jgi:hypothetical protein